MSQAAARTALAALAEAELAGDAPDACGPFCDEIRRRHGAAVAAVLFYGSCLRTGDAEGVLDFYALVDDYRRAYGSRPLAWLNAALPPNVFYLEAAGYRAKVAVVSLADFARGAAPEALRPAIWARFSQPFAAPFLRDAAARDAVSGAAATAMRTAVVRGLGLLPTEAGSARTSAEAFFTRLFRETYASELRPESDARVGSLYGEHPERYARMLAAGLETLASEGRLAYTAEGPDFRIRDAPDLLGRPRRLRRHAAKALGAVQLLKSAFTFGDWLPYALWKLERHTGTRLEPSERQRRHPLLFGWPLIFRALARRDLR